MKMVLMIITMMMMMMIVVNHLFWALGVFQFFQSLPTGQIPSKFMEEAEKD